MSERDYIISKAYRDMGWVEKGLPSALRQASSLGHQNTAASKYIQSRQNAHVFGRNASAFRRNSPGTAMRNMDEGRYERGLQNRSLEVAGLKRRRGA